MLKSGLDKIYPDDQDYHFIPSFGATQFDAAGLPNDFSIYAGQDIPNQDAPDTRFMPPLPALYFGCTGESVTFASGLEDGALYNPKYTYEHTPPGTYNTGRDIRTALKSAIRDGLQRDDLVVGFNRKSYFNVYAAGRIDDFDAARIAIWITQEEKRGVIVGTWWYWEFLNPDSRSVLPTPSFDMKQSNLHCWLITGWKTINGAPHLECLSWQGHWYGNNGVVYLSRELYNALINQPYTAAFTITKLEGFTPITIGARVYIDHLVAFIKSLFDV